MQRKRDRLAGALAEIGFDVLPAHGTYFVTTDFRPLGFNGTDEDFCRHITVEAGVTAVPVSAFYDEPEAGAASLRPVLLLQARRDPGRGDRAAERAFQAVSSAHRNFMQDASYLAKLGDAARQLRHITALRLPISDVSFSTVAATIECPWVGAPWILDVARRTVSQTAADRWPPPAQRTHQAAHHRGVPVAAARQSADADGGADRRAGGLFRALDLRALSRPQCAARRGDRLRSWRRPLALAPPRGADGDRETRLRSQVKTRAHTCERGVALWRVLLQFADQDDTGQLKQRVARSRETTVGRIELMYRRRAVDLAGRTSAGSC